MSSSNDDLPPDPELDALYEKLLKKLFKGGKNSPSGGIDVPTATHTAQTLMKGVFEGYGGTYATIAYNTPDYDKLMHLEKNVYQFSGAKNWQMLKELTRSLKEGDKIVPYREFKNKAITILDEYDRRYLQTEYNAAIAGAQMASKWVDFEKGAALRKEEGLPEPLLQYRTMEDERVRETHQALNRITRPVSDNFWKTYYPPNGWNCRCTVVQTTSNKKSSDQDTNRAMADVTPQKGFGVNLAEEGFVFAKNSAYYTGLPADQDKAHLSIQRATMEKYAKEHLVGNKFPSPIGEISINMTGIKKTLSQPHRNIFEKNNALYKLPEILKDAEHIASVSDSKDRLIQVHYLKITIAGNKPSYAMIKESNNGDLNLYTIQDNNKGFKKKNG